MSDEESRWSRRRRLNQAYAAGREDGGSDLSSSSASSASNEGPEPRRRRIAESSSDETDSDNDGDEIIESGDNEEEEEQDEEEAENESVAEEDNVNMTEEEDEGQMHGGEDADHNEDDVDNNGEAGPNEEQGGDPNLEDLYENNNDNASGSDAASSSSDSESEGSESSEEEDDDDDDDDGDDDGDDEDGGAPLYENARISQMESIIMILTFALTFSLSGQCLVRLLEIIERHCPPVNRCITTLYKFKKIFSDIGRNILVSHYFCQRCYSPLEQKDSVCNLCGNLTDVAFFIEIPFVNQLQRMFLRPGFVQNLSYRFNRQKKHNGNYEDIYDGRLYKQLMGENGFLNNIFNLSFMWYTDGISIFKSSKFSVWPLFFVINELNYKMRTRKENIVLAGLWFGKCKPQPNLFLRPFRNTFDTFYNQGFQFQVPEGDPITVKGLLLCGTCDLQAKGLFLKMKLSNGYFGCSKCRSSGQRVAAGRTTVHVHDYVSPQQMRLRNNDNIPALARERRLGYKGLSLLHFLMPSMIRGTAIDGMHMIFLGISKLLTKLWFDPRFHGEPFSCSRMIDVVNQRLVNIKPPSFVQRLTRTLSDLKLWKAREYKLWFFYYSVVVMHGVLENVYLQHHLKLVSAVSLLFQGSIFPEQVDAAEALLHEYVREFVALYTLRFMGMNIHLLLHLAEMVRDLGPLWVYCCFFFEDLNGQLAKLIHGPHQVGLQICSSASLFLSLKTLIDGLNPGSLAKSFCQQLNSVGSNYTIAEHVSEKVKILGRSAFDMNVSAAAVQAIREKFNVVNGHFQSFFLMRRSGVIFNCESKINSTKRCSIFAEFIQDGTPFFGKITEFVRVSDCNCGRVCLCNPAEHYCIVQKYERIEWFAHQVRNVRIAYLSAVQPTGGLIATLSSSIQSICFYMNVEGAEYVAIPVNDLEYE